MRRAGWVSGPEELDKKLPVPSAAGTEAAQLCRNKPGGGTEVPLPKGPVSGSPGKALLELSGWRRHRGARLPFTPSAAQQAFVHSRTHRFLGSPLAGPWGNQARRKAWRPPQKARSLATQYKKCPGRSTGHRGALGGRSTYVTWAGGGSA